jgi:hypothetical protein
MDNHPMKLINAVERNLSYAPETKLLTDGWTDKLTVRR